MYSPEFIKKTIYDMDFDKQLYVQAETLFLLRDRMITWQELLFA